MPNILPAVIREAGGWLADCDDSLPDNLTDSTIIIMIHRNFEGGWDGFVDSDRTVDSSVVFAEIIAKYGDQFAANIYPHGGPWPASLYE